MNFLRETMDTARQAFMLYFAPVKTWWFWVLMLAVSVYFIFA
jgi:hypothetical protein